MTYLRLSQVPSMAGFGEGPSLSDTNPFEASGTTKERLIAALTPCGIQATWDPAGAATCAWTALRSVIEASPDVQGILTTIAYSDCGTALAALGLPSDVTNVLCIIPTINSLWAAFQSRAKSELSRIEGATISATYEENYDRGRDRSAAEGGGHTLVDAAGEEIGVWCPGYVESISYDAAGNPAVFVMAHPNDYPPGTTCPQSATPTKPSTSRTVVRFKPTVSAVGQTGGRTQSGRISGTVVDKSGAPVAGATFTVDGVVMTTGSARTGGIRPFATDATGAFTIGRVPGKHSVQIDVPGYAPVVLQNVDFVAGTTVDLGRIEAGTGKMKSEGAAGGGSWYTSPWFIISGLAVAGGAGYLIYRSRQK